MIFSRLIVGLNNFSTRLRRPRVEPGELLLLLPHCLQGEDCSRRLDADLANCARCGRCVMPEMLDLAERYACRIAVASGGKQAVAAAKSPGVRAIVVVACHAELAAGLLVTFPTPVYAIANRLPNGPCKATEVAVDEVEDALCRMLKVEYAGECGRRVTEP